MNTEDKKALLQLKAGLMADVSTFIAKLEELSKEDPESYPIDGSIGNIEMFAKHIQMIDW